MLLCAIILNPRAARRRKRLQADAELGAEGQHGDAREQPPNAPAGTDESAEKERLPDAVRSLEWRNAPSTSGDAERALVVVDAEKGPQGHTLQTTS